MSSFMKFSLLQLPRCWLARHSPMRPILYEPPIVEVVPEMRTAVVGGWYLRGDIGYSHSVNGVRYYQGVPTLTGKFEKHDLGESWSLAVVSVIRSPTISAWTSRLITLSQLILTVHLPRA